MLELLANPYASSILVALITAALSAGYQFTLEADRAAAVSVAKQTFWKTLVFGLVAALAVVYAVHRGDQPVSSEPFTVDSPPSS
jgi:hypothetical protein